MRTTTIVTQRASAPDLPRPSNQNHDDFSRDAVYAEFRRRDARAIDYDGFVDRQPGQASRPIGEIAIKVARDAGQASLDHWLKKAAKARTAEDRAAALTTAREIARLLGLPHANLIGLGAA